MGQFVSGQKCPSRKRYNSPKPVSPYRRVIPRVPMIIRDLQAKIQIEIKENPTDSMFEYLKGKPECMINPDKRNVNINQTENERETSCTNSESHTELIIPCHFLRTNSFSKSKETASTAIKSLFLNKSKPRSEQLSPKIINHSRFHSVKSLPGTSRNSNNQFSFHALHCSPKPHFKKTERPYKRIPSQVKVSMSGYIQPKLKPTSKSHNQFLKLKHAILRSKCITYNKYP